jgi:hypothetical protein
LSVVADFDEAREEPAESLYRPLSALPYSPAVIRRCCEFLIRIADSPESGVAGDHEMLVRERDALGLALFSLDFFLDLPASEIPRHKLENAEYVKQQYLAGSTPPPKPTEGDVIYKTGLRLKDYVDQVIGVSENDEWMVLTKSGLSMQIVRGTEAGKWEEVKSVAPAAASWLDFTPPFGVPAQ